MSNNIPMIVVIGGSGYIGSHICREAVKRGLQVRSVSRSGKPGQHIQGDWSRKVEYYRGDLFNVDGDWKQHFTGANAIISCVGGFGSNEWMKKINGEPNINAFRAAKSVGIPRAVFISAHQYKLPSFIQESGYYQGKRSAERVVTDLYGTNGVILRLTFAYGTRNVGTVPVPLGLIGAPLKWMTSINLIQSLNNVPVLGTVLNSILAPPVSADDVASAAVEAAINPSISGIVTAHEMNQGIGNQKKTN